jgi:hypothetical protein
MLHLGQNRTHLLVRPLGCLTIHPMVLARKGLTLSKVSLFDAVRLLTLSSM